MRTRDKVKMKHSEKYERMNKPTYHTSIKLVEEKLNIMKRRQFLF